MGLYQSRCPCANAASMCLPCPSFGNSCTRCFCAPLFGGLVFVPIHSAVQTVRHTVEHHTVFPVCRNRCIIKEGACAMSLAHAFSMRLYVTSMQVTGTLITIFLTLAIAEASGAMPTMCASAGCRMRQSPVRSTCSRPSS